MNILEQIRDHLSNLNFHEGYRCIYNLLVERSTSNNYIPNREDILINIFSEEINKIALNYNKINCYDIENYTKDTNKMKNMCNYLQRTYLTKFENKSNLLNDIIKNAWNKADEVRYLKTAGCISVMKHLPSGNPPVFGKWIGSFM